MRFGLFPFLFIGAMMIVLCILMLVGLAHSQQGPSIIIAPNGGVTYVYPGPPAVVIGPNGGVSTIYPTTPAPVYVPPVVSVPPAAFGGK